MKKQSRWFTLVSVVAVSIVAAACGSSGSVTGPADLAAAPRAETEGGVGIASIAVDACRTITRVELTLVPTPGTAQVPLIRATYFNGRTAVKCSIAPEWASTPQGLLLATKDPFVVGAQKSLVAKSTLVKGTAPTGVAGEIRIRN